jgi:hypothetical protein
MPNEIMCILVLCSKVQDTPPIRGRSRSVPQPKLELQSPVVKTTPMVQAREKSKMAVDVRASSKTAAEHTYERSYEKWDKFDVV